MKNKKCYCTSCGYFDGAKSNNCAMIRDLTYSGCTMNESCEVYRTPEEVDLLESILLDESLPYLGKNHDEKVKRYAELIQERKSKKR